MDEELRKREGFLEEDFDFPSLSMNLVFAKWYIKMKLIKNQWIQMYKEMLLYNRIIYYLKKNC